MGYQLLSTYCVTAYTLTHNMGNGDGDVKAVASPSSRRLGVRRLYPAHGFTTFTFRPSKCRTFPVATAARRASAIPAIRASGLSLFESR